MYIYGKRKIRMLTLQTLSARPFDNLYPKRGSKKLETLNRSTVSSFFLGEVQFKTTDFPVPLRSAERGWSEVHRTGVNINIYLAAKYPVQAT